MNGAMILGASQLEASDCISTSTSNGLDQSQMLVDGPVVLNRSPELEADDLMVLDEQPAQALKQPHLIEQQQAASNGSEKGVKKQRKRKRATNGSGLSIADKDALIAGCCQELDGLFEFYKEVSGHRIGLEGGHSSSNVMVALLLEESKLAFSKLVEEIYDKLKGREGVTLASVRSSVLFVGQRAMYGTSSPDADVLEDESESALWCWEVRDLKLLPASLRGFLSIRRTARKKIHDRISAISSTLSVLHTPESAQSQVSDLKKASVKLGKALNLGGIRSMVERLTQKKNAEMDDKEVRSKTKEMIKGFEEKEQNMQKEGISSIEKQNGKVQNDEEAQKNVQQEAEKEMKRHEKEEAEMRKKQKRQQDEAHREQRRCENEEAELRKQQKKQQEEAQKEQKRREKEEAELKKQQKRQQEEAEKEQKRREKEAVQLKNQLAIQKQANMMKRFLKSKKDGGKLDKPEDTVPIGTSIASSSSENTWMVSAATSLIDCSFSQQENWALEDLQRLHISSWQKLSGYNRSSRWGIRRKPKTEAFKELKLLKSSDNVSDGILSAPNENTCLKSNQESEPSFDKLMDDLDVSFANEMPSHDTNDAAPVLIRLIKRKLLQFDKSNRPAYYGTWRKKSCVVGPRHPFRMDPDLDYEVDSDEEWEEEDPGESLSDCDKDDDENMEDDLKIADEGESEDSFVVPDGYLSDNEGVQVEGFLSDKEEEVSSSPSNQSPEVDEFRALLRQQKVLHNLTEQALRKSQPLVISNLNHGKAEPQRAEGLLGKAKLEQLCLQVLSMRICPGGAAVDVPVLDTSSENAQDTCTSNNKKSSVPSPAGSAIPDSDLPEIVRMIRSCPHGINKLVDLLQQRFPSVSKSQLKSKVREISDFIDNHWQVKREILDKLGLAPSPVKRRKTKGIATYFSKRCLPPEDAIKAMESSPEPRLKTKTPQNNCSIDCPQIDVLPSSQ